MNLLPSVFGKPHDVARALQERFAADHVSLHLLPFKSGNREPSPYIWWLGRRVENPSYKLAKLIISSRDSAGIFCGLHVERGYDSDAMPPGERHQKTTWAWDRVMARLPKDMSADAARAELAAGEPLTLYVNAPAGRSDEGERVDFQVRGGALTFIGASARHGALPGLEACASFADLARSLEARPAEATAMRWTNMVIGSACTTDAAGPNEVARVTEMLRCFLSWL